MLRNNDTGAVILVKQCEEFKVAGSGKSNVWSKAQWHTIQQRTSADRHLDTKVKMLYSGSGLYFLFSCSDKKITSDKNRDFAKLWEGDVVEVFIQPNESHTDYLEYEISPLNYELPILVSNRGSELFRWIPFMYEPNRKTRHATFVSGGEKKNGASIKEWSAEFYIPYKLLEPLSNIHPATGKKWKINFYRKDYDKKDVAEWEWQQTGGDPHNYKRFGNLIFE